MTAPSPYRVMHEMSRYIEREVPESAYVSLLADGKAYRLYQQFRFALTAPTSVGRAQVKRADANTR